MKALKRIEENHKQEFQTYFDNLEKFFPLKYQINQFYTKYIGFFQDNEYVFPKLYQPSDQPLTVIPSDKPVKLENVNKIIYTNINSNCLWNGVDWD